MSGGLRASDIPQALRLSETAGWNQTGEDWKRLLQLEPSGCFGIEADGVLAATATVVCYGTELAWIGMVLTAPEYRGRGFARTLMANALRYVADRGVRCVKLDASDMGRPLYEQLGFQTECMVERWHRPAGLQASKAPVLSDAPFDWTLDRDTFGADRRPLLERLASIESVAIAGGYAMSRPGCQARYFGPCLAESRREATDLVEWFLAHHGHEPAYWDFLSDNTDALELAGSYGFSLVRRLTRMVYGAPVAGLNPRVFAIAGLEYG